MSEVAIQPPVVAPESPPVPGGEAGDVGVGDGGFFGVLESSDGGTSPGPEIEPPAQQVPVAPGAAPAAPVAAQVPAAPVQPGEIPVQQPVPAKDDPSRFEHWQQQATQEKLARETLENSHTVQIARFIQNNPEMLDVVESGMQGGGVSSLPALPVKPVRPIKPGNYDTSEAHDSETVSGKYRADFYEYQEKNDVYNEALGEQNVQRDQRRTEQVHIADLRAGLVSQGGLQESEAEEAMRFFNSPEARDPRVLANLFRVSKAPTQDIIANNAKAAELLARQPSLGAPLPLAVANGDSPAVSTDADNYRSSLTQMASTIEL